MSNQLIYKCKLTQYFVEYIENDNIAYINAIGSDYKNLKAFLALLRSSVDNLKKKNICKIRQSVAFSEWENYLINKTTWEIKKIDNMMKIYEIECPIDDFLENYGIGIGL